eukprot:symbB.v1.2.038509.t2/scaffold6022.1/size21679/2
MAEGSQVQSAREPRDVLKTAGSQVGTILALGSTGKTNNLLLVRDDVGRPKPTCFNLPDHQFSYGRPGNQDSEGAREVSMRWVGHTRSKRMQAEEPDFMSVNRKAAADRVTNARDLRQYFRQVPDPPRLSARKGNLGKPLIPSDVIPGFAYGRKVRPSTPIQEVSCSISSWMAQRKQQKLLGFGPRWQTADPTQSLTREREVQQALQHLEEACVQQRRVQDHGQAECEAELKGTEVVLTRRRGQAIESFGHRQDGEWILEPEETLYLAERGSLAVLQASEDGNAGWMVGGFNGFRHRFRMTLSPVKRRRLKLPELYSRFLGSDSVDSYMVYAHLRRSGFKVSRPEAAASQHSWDLTSSVNNCRRVHVVRPETPMLQSLLQDVAAETWEGQVEALENALDEAPSGIAVAHAARGSPAFLEICKPCCRGETSPDGQGTLEGGEFAVEEPLQLSDLPPTVSGEEQAMPVAQRYAAMLQRVGQLSAAEVSVDLCAKVLLD